MPAVFISYSRRDKSFVAQLHEALAARGYDVWVDWEDIPPSAEWFAEIQEGVRHADGFIYVISPDSVASEICGKELAHAFDQHKRVVPVLHREPNGVPVPEQAAALNWVFLRSDDDFDAGIQTLVQALETDLDHVRVHTRLGVQADRWQRSGRDASQLLRGSDLTAAEGWLVAGAGKRPEATELQREYILASRQAATRRQRVVIGAVSIALVVAVALAITALIQRATAVTERHVAVVRQLDADAQANLSTDPELSVLLAARAANQQINPQTDQMLRTSLQQSMVRLRYRLSSDTGGDTIWAPDGRRLLVTSPGTGGWARIYTPGAGSRYVALPGPSGAGESGWDARGDRVLIGGGRPAVYAAATGRLVARLPGSALYGALSPDGRRAVTLDVHAIGHVIDIASGRVLATFTPQLRGGSSCFAVSPDGRYAADCEESNLDLSAQVDPGQLALWDTRTGRLVRAVSTPGPLSSVAFSPDSRRFVITTLDTFPASGSQSARNGGAAGTLVYDTTGHGPPVVTFHGAATVAEFDPAPGSSGQALAYATANDVAYVYQFATGVAAPLVGATDIIRTLHFNPAGGYVVTGSDDGSVRVYQAYIGGPPIETLAGHGNRIDDAELGAGDRLVASSADDGTARIWQGPALTPSAQLADRPFGDFGVGSIGFSPNGDRIVLTGGDAPGITSGRGRILDAATLRMIASFSAPGALVFAGGGDTPSGRILEAVALRGKQGLTYVGALTYNDHTGRRLASFVPSRPMFDATIDNSGRRLALLESGGRAELFDMITGHRLHVLDGESTPAATAEFTGDGRILAVAHYPVLPSRITTATGLGRATVQLWDVATGHLLRTLKGERVLPQGFQAGHEAPLAIAFSSDGSSLALGGADTHIDVFRVGDGRLTQRLDVAASSGGSYASTLLYSPNGRTLAAGSGSAVYLYSVPGYARIAVLAHVAQSSSSLVTLSSDIHLGFSADSRTLLTVGDYRLRVWNVAAGLRLFALGPENGLFVTNGSLDDAARRIVTATQAGITTYPCDLCGTTRQLINLVRTRVTRGFTPAERARYLTGS